MSQLSRPHVVPLWLIVILLTSGVGAGLFAYYVWNTLVIPLEVKEPLEIISYPSELSLFPGETKEFDITVQNHASVNYSVTLEFSLDNATYQDNYVTFSNELYTVVPGQQILSAWLVVEPYALPTNSSLTIRLVREPSGTFMATEQLEIQGVTFSGSSGNATNTLVLTVQNIGTADLTVSAYKLGVSGTQHDITDVSVAQGASASVTCTTGTDGEAWTTGTTYDIYLITSSGKQFPYRATAPGGQQAGAVLVLENVRFYAVDSTNNRTEIVIRNTGTSSAKIVAVYWSSSSFSALAKIGSSEYTMSPSTGVVDALSSITIMVKWGTSGGVVTDSTWTSGNTYYFKVVTEAGQYLQFSGKAP